MGEVSRVRNPLTAKQRRRLNPTPLSQFLVSIVVRLLPPEDRARAHTRLYDDLCTTPRRRQSWFALTLLARAMPRGWSYFGEPSEPSSATGWRCPRRQHRWITRHDPGAERAEGAYYLECTRCGAKKDRYRGQVMIAPVFPTNS